MADEQSSLYKNKLGDNIKRALEKRGRTQSWLARKMEKSRQHISQWCNNDIKPNQDNLFVIANLLGYTVEELITGSFLSRAKEAPNEYDVIVQSEKESIISVLEVLATENDISPQKKNACISSVMSKIDWIIETVQNYEKG